jgi:5'/3'-nucleotidase SurE
VFSEWILLVNDDGVDSPALMPFAQALSELSEVRIVVPDGERSWSGKAISRTGEVRTQQRELGSFMAFAHSGTPADGVQLGVHHLFDTPPSLVVSGINLGFNYGSAFAWSSGTIGAAIEGSLAGVPAVAVSTGPTGDWDAWRQHALTEDAEPTWRRISKISKGVIADLPRTNLLEDNGTVSINMEFQVDDSAPRKITHVEPTGYGPVLTATPDGAYRYEFSGGIFDPAHREGSDIAVVSEGGISITRIDLAGRSTISEASKLAIEGRVQ